MGNSIGGLQSNVNDYTDNNIDRGRINTENIETPRIKKNLPQNVRDTALMKHIDQVLYNRVASLNQVVQSYDSLITAASGDRQTALKDEKANLQQKIIKDYYYNGRLMDPYKRTHFCSRFQEQANTNSNNSPFNGTTEATVAQRKNVLHELVGGRSTGGNAEYNMNKKSIAIPLPSYTFTSSEGPLIENDANNNIRYPKKNLEENVETYYVNIQNPNARDNIDDFVRADGLEGTTGENKVQNIVKSEYNKNTPFSDDNGDVASGDDYYTIIDKIYNQKINNLNRGVYSELTTNLNDQIESSVPI